MVTAKITCLPSNLSPSQSYYQDGHDDTSESCGVYDGRRSSYFPHAPSASGVPFNTCKPRIYMCVVSANLTCLPSTYLLLKATINTVTAVSRKPAGCMMEGAHHIFPMHRVHLGLLPTRPSPVTYMYVVSAKIPCLPSKLYSPQSYCQHGHISTSQC